MKKIALAFIFILFLSVLSRTTLVYWVLANPAPYASSGNQKVHVSIVSPENKTYNTNDILATVTAGGFPGVAYVRYSVDDGPPIDLDPINWWGHDFSASVWLKQLPQGSHKIVATAKTFETSEVCSTVYFTVTKILELSPSPSPTATSDSQKIQLTIKVQGITRGPGFCDLEFSVYVPYEIQTLYNCIVKVDYRTINNEWKTSTKNIGTVNYGDYTFRQVPLEADSVSEGPPLVDSDEWDAILGIPVKIEGYGYLEPTVAHSPEPSSEIEPFPTAVVAVVVSLAVVDAGLLLYFRKRKS